MKVEIKFYGDLQRLAAAASITLELPTSLATIGDVLQRLSDTHRLLHKQLIDEVSSRSNPVYEIIVNGRIMSHEETCQYLIQDGSRIEIFPALCGGSTLEGSR